MKIIAFLLALSMTAGVTTVAQARFGSNYSGEKKLPEATRLHNTPTWQMKYNRMMSKYEQHEKGCPCATCKTLRNRYRKNQASKFGHNKSERHTKKNHYQKACNKNENHKHNEKCENPDRDHKKISIRWHSQPDHVCRTDCDCYSYHKPSITLHRTYESGDQLYHEYFPSLVQIKKQDHVSSVDVNIFQFDSVVRRRAYFITKEGIADDLLSDSPSSFDEYMEYRSRTGEVVMATSGENTSRLLTILKDNETYRAFLAFYSGKTDSRVDVVSVVNRELLESDPEAARQIADENVDNIEKLLGNNTHIYKYSPARIWYNPNYGTVTIIDLPGKINKVKEFMQVRPYHLAQL